MYWLLFLGLLGLGGWIASPGLTGRNPVRTTIGLVVVVSTLLFFVLLSLWGELLWFEATGYEPRFWRMLAAVAGSTLLFGALGAGSVRLLCTLLVPRDSRRIRRWVTGLSAFSGAVIGLASWERLLLFLFRVETGVLEPILGHDTAFYLFTLPLLDRLFVLMVSVAFFVVSAAALTLVEPPEEPVVPLRVEISPRRLARAGLAVAFVGAVGLWLGRYHLLYSNWGVVAGPGWTDVHVRLPAYWVVGSGTLLLAAAPLWPWLARRVRPAFDGGANRRALGRVATAWIAIAGLWIVGLVVLPNLVQFLVVEPNEITFEKEYIGHNIDFTRRGFRLDTVEERQFPAAEELTPSVVEESEHLLSEARLWDVRALDAVYRQFQEIRLYYAFHDVDIDRYVLGDRYRQVMISARELDLRNLPRQSQTFVNERFKYTHGYGLTLATVRDFTPDGLPNLLVKDIPPRAVAPELQVERPQIYYGELTVDPAVVNSREPEFDYPSGDENVTTFYSGTGGVRLENLWRKFVLGWRFDGTQFFFSAYMTPETRVLFHRRVQDRVATLAPFLELDDDPYVVLANGRVYWLLDAYTVSAHYPYSEPFSARERIEYGQDADQASMIQMVMGRLQGANYVRNSVKAVIDAYDGTTTLYVFDAKDPLIRAWRRVFPGLFRDADEMPEALRAHVRYPDGFLLTQGLVYAKYHMADPEVFYNQEDLWVRATEKYYERVQPVEPYYVMWQLPGSERAEFVAILPFTPKNRQVMIGWIAGMCDGDNYGRFLAYKFPKEKRVLGPQQVETKIDQDRFLSGQLTLWDQRGSAVIRGNVIAIPIGDTLLYVEPIYLQAETAAYPELRLVVLMHGDDLSYGETFEEALAGLLARQEDDRRTTPSADAPQPAASLEAEVQRASRILEDYLRLQGEGRFEDAGRELERLRAMLLRLSEAAEDG